MDEVISTLESGALKTYLLDSQAGILEEYLHTMLEKEPMIRKLAEEGELTIGPWYTQSDELIISGESLARNLQYGISYVKELGNCVVIGYLPDPPGQSKDMPRLHNGLDIREALFWRGVPNDVYKQREFYRRNIDGSEVLCYHIRDRYFYDGNLIYIDGVGKVESRVLNGVSTAHQLLSLGGDQRYVDFNLRGRLSYYNERSTHDTQYFESDLENFFKELREEGGLPQTTGEFIGAPVSKIHHFIYPSHYDHKQLSDIIERRMIYQLEPFTVMQMQMRIRPKASLLRKLWKKVSLNHTRDGVCGYSSGAINNVILQRLRDCDQASSVFLDYQVRELSESIEGICEQDLMLHNTLPYTRDDVYQVPVSTKTRHFRTVDEAGYEIAYGCLRTQRVHSGNVRRDPSVYDEDLCYYQNGIRIVMTMKSISMRILHLEACEHTEQLQKCSAFRNTFYKITMENDSLRLLNKTNGKVVEGFLYVEDSGDEGDTYDYSWPAYNHIYALHFRDAQTEWKHETLADTLISRGVWQLPENLQGRIDGRCSQDIVYTLCIQLHQASDVLQCEMTVNNTAMEHRMRVVLRGLSSSPYSTTDILLGIVQKAHDLRYMEDWKEADYRGEPTPIYPVLHHVSNEASQVLACFCKGMREYEILKYIDIALTLLRSVPLFGRPDLNRHLGIAGGNGFKYTPTPKSELR